MTAAPAQVKPADILNQPTRPAVSPELVARRKATLARNRAELANIREVNKLQPPPWRPSLDAFEKATELSRHGRRTTVEIADLMGAPHDQFRDWWQALNAALAARPHALLCLRNLLDLRESGGRW
jgi:hypothetical protein